LTRPAEGVARAEDDAADAVEQHRPHAHHARLQRRVAGQLAGARPEALRHLPQRLDLGVPAGVVDGPQHGVTGLRDHLAAERDDRTHRQVAPRLRFERELHGPPQVPQVVLRRMWSRAGHGKKK
jgi:hypothetical protein